MNISHFRFILFNLKIFNEIVTTYGIFYLKKRSKSSVWGLWTPTTMHLNLHFKRKVAFAWNVFELERCGVANFSTLDPLWNCLTDSGSNPPPKFYNNTPLWNTPIQKYASTKILLNQSTTLTDNLILYPLTPALNKFRPYISISYSSLDSKKYDCTLSLHCGHALVWRSKLLLQYVAGAWPSGEGS